MALTAAELIDLERKFSPTVVQAPAVFSPLERTRVDALNAGGDKMAPDRNGYAEVYARLLADLDPWTMVELGVFRGESLAVWCDVFPDTVIYGLDVDLSRYHEHYQTLRDRGAFRSNYPFVYEFDAYEPDAPELEGLDGIDLFIDDGPHTADAIENVLRLFGPMMNQGGVYVVEDFPDGDRLLEAQFPKAHIIRAGRLNAACL